MPKPAVVPTWIAMAGFLCVACGPPHVELSAPPKHANAPAREAAYERLRPRSEFEIESGIRGGVPASVLRTSDKLQLAGGAQVYYAEDLRPVLTPGSRARWEADRAASKTTMATVLDIAGVVLLVAGTAVAIAPFLTTSGDESVSTQPIYIGTGIAVLSIPTFLWSGAERREVQDAKANVFEAYEPALRERLNLCTPGPGPTVTPCEQAVH